MTRGRTFRLLETTVRVTGEPDAAIDWLHEFFGPTLDEAPPHPFDFEVVLIRAPGAFDAIAAARPSGGVDTAPLFALDQKVIARPCWKNLDGTVVADEKFEAFYVLRPGRVEVVSPPGSTRARTGAMRVLREILTARALAHAARLQLHAAALRLDAGAVLLAGPKECGKTTFLCHLSRATGAPILTNDRALLELGERSVEVRGVPTIVSLRRGTLALIPGVLRKVAPVSLPAHLTLREFDAVAVPVEDIAHDRGFKLSPAQLARALGVDLAATAPLAAVAFPEHHERETGIEAQRLPVGEARERLLAARYGLRSGKSRPTLIEEWSGSRRDLGADERLIARLAAEVPCFALRLGSGVYRERGSAREALSHLLGTPPFAGDAA